MIVLDSITKKLEAVLAGAVAANQLEITAFYFDVIPQQTTTSPRSSPIRALTNNTSDVVVVPAPAINGIRRNIHTLFCHNKDTAAAIVTIKLDDNGTQTIFVKQTLNAGDSLNYEHGMGWSFTTPLNAPFVDTTSLVKGSSDATKQLRIEVDGITTLTTRVWTAPDSDLTVVGTDTTQTLTNKSLTSPTLTGTPVAPTPAAGDSSTKIATTAFVAGTAPTVQVFTTTGANTWTKPAGLKGVRVELYGGGGGGGTANSGAGAASAGGGGGGGGYSMKVIAAASLGSTETATVGAGGGSTVGGGTSSFGAHCSATGGNGASSGGADINGVSVSGGSGSGGNVNGSGGTGQGGLLPLTSGGYGADSPLGGGGAAAVSSTSGGAATGKAAGGGGAYDTGSSTKSGGAGAPGIIIVYEFY